jgi:exopolysaccharide production protein ExoQ
MRICILIEKYAFFLILLFCLGLFSPNFDPKVPMMDMDAMEFLDKISGSDTKKQVFWVVMFALLFWRVFSNNILSKNKFFGFFLIMLLCFVALFSVLWSESSWLTVKRSVFQFIFCFCVVISFYYAEYNKTIIPSLVFSAYLVFIMTAFTLLFGVGFTTEWQLAAFANTKNLLGQNLLVLLVFFFVYIKVTKVCWIDYKYIVFFLVLMLFLSGSKTSIALFLLFLFLGFCQAAFVRFFASFLFLSLFLFFVVVPPVSFFIYETVHVGNFVEDSFFTGRGIIWDTLYYDLEFFSKFNLGYGYGAYFGAGTVPWFFDDDFSFLKHIASSHNGYIDILLQFGLWGGGLLLFVLLFLGRGLRNKWICSGVMVVVIYNFTESAFLKDQAMMWVLFLVLFSFNAILIDKADSVKKGLN